MARSVTPVVAARFPMSIVAVKLLVCTKSRLWPHSKIVIFQTWNCARVWLEDFFEYRDIGTKITIFEWVQSFVQKLQKFSIYWYWIYFARVLWLSPWAIICIIYNAHASWTTLTSVQTHRDANLCIMWNDHHSLQPSRHRQAKTWTTWVGGWWSHGHPRNNDRWR